MPLLAVQFTLDTTSGVPENRCVNTWHFDDGTGGYYEEIWTALQAYYNDISLVYPAYITQGNHTVKMYKYSDPEPRAPVFEDFFSFSNAPSGNPLPTEVSCVMSYQSLPVSGVPQARRRGRVYIGPLNVSMIGTDGRLIGTCTNAIKAAGQNLLDASTGQADWDWATYSRVLGTGANVDNGWVDNEPDTQRRRGREATVRQIFS